MGIFPRYNKENQYNNNTHYRKEWQTLVERGKHALFTLNTLERCLSQAKFAQKNKKKAKNAQKYPFVKQKKTGNDSLAGGWE